jgi:hypothetical protein
VLHAVFSEAKKLPMAALSQTLREPHHRADDAVIGYQSLESSLVYWLSRSE